MCHLRACSTGDCGPSLEGRVASLDLDLDDLDLEEDKCRSEGKPGPWTWTLDLDLVLDLYLADLNLWGDKPGPGRPGLEWEQTWTLESGKPGPSKPSKAHALKHISSFTHFKASQIDNEATC